MEQSNNLKLPLIDVNNAEDLKKTFIDYVKMISGVDDSSALQILDRVIKDLQTTKQDKLTPGENITIDENNVISSVGGQGGVNAEDVMNIINENAEQTNTLGVGTSATFDATSDEQIPTSKAVSDLMASAGGGSKLYKHIITINPNLYRLLKVEFICDRSEPFGSSAEFGAYLYDNNFKNDYTQGMPCTGYWNTYDSANYKYTEIIIPHYIMGANNNSPTFRGTKIALSFIDDKYEITNITSNSYGVFSASLVDRVYEL